MAAYGGFFSITRLWLLSQLTQTSRRVGSSDARRLLEGARSHPQDGKRWARFLSEAAVSLSGLPNPQKWYVKVMLRDTDSDLVAKDVHEPKARFPVSCRSIFSKEP